MKTPLLKALPALALCVFGLRAAANDIEPGKEFYTVRYAPKPIVLDGDLSEWSGLPVLADPKFAVPKYSGTNANPNYVLFEEYGGTWSGPDDQTSAVQIVYDADNVYFGFVVTDDYHENMSQNAWNGDSVQLMIADATRTTQVALYNYALGGYEDNILPNKNGTFVPDPALADPIMINHEAGPAADPNCNCATTAFIKRDSVNKRTIYEIKLPKAALGLTTLKGGVQFGLGMAINDGDGALVNGVQYGEAGQEGQKGWGGLGCHAIVFGKTPAECALITLATNNDIEPTKEYYTALRTTNTIVIDGVLSEWTGAPVLSDPKFAIPKYSGTNDTPNYVLFEEYGGTWSGPDDQTSAVQIVYDADNVYFGFVVTDDYHENMSQNAWNGDSVQLMIADATRTQQIALYNYALGGYEDNILPNKNGTFIPDPALADPIMINHEAGPAADPTCNCATTAVIKRDSVNKKTIYEIKLPAASLGLTPPLTNGTQFGLGMAINDGDGALVNGVQYGEAGQEGQKGWGGLGCHAIVFGKTPSETALVTLGGTVSGSDRLFLSTILPTMTGLSFRVTDKGNSILDTNSVKVTIDGQPITMTASPKVLDATDFTYTAPTPFAPNSQHTYTILVKDTGGNVVTDSATFTVINYAILTKAQQAVSVDKTKPGFFWNVFQNETYVPNSIASAELALIGQLTDPNSGLTLDNWADPNQTGPATGVGVLVGTLYQFAIPTVLNLSLNAGDTTGYITPDDQMPGQPGTTGAVIGIDAEVITFVDLPAGWVTMAIASDDSVLVQAGYVNKPADGTVLFVADASTASATTKFLVQDAGIYPIRVVYQQATGLAYLELSTVKSNSTTKVLLNDTANGGLKAYRSGVAPNKPTTFSLGIQKSGGTINITWTQPGVVLQQSTNLKTWTDLTGATSPYSPTVPGFYRLKQ
jgi:hypothetical protein